MDVEKVVELGGTAGKVHIEKKRSNSRNFERIARLAINMGAPLFFFFFIPFCGRTTFFWPQDH